MPQEADITDFTAGELSPKLKGRTDLKKYFSGCETMLNMVVLPQGGATKRPPTIYVANNKDQGGLNRPVRFVFNTLQAYILEFSNGNVRVYMDDGVVLSGGSTPVDISVPYTGAELQQLKFVQSADTLYIYHPNHPPATLTRSSHTAWTYADLVTRDGPYLDVNTTDTMLTVTGTAGNVTIDASATAGINGGAGFATTDVGRQVRVKIYSLWAWAIIYQRNSTTQVLATVQDATGFGAAAAMDGGAWAANTEYQTNAIVSNGGLYYICTVGGKSGTGDGPQGRGAQMIDGTATWSMVGGYNAVAWQTNTLYDSGVIIVTAAGDYYQSIIAGASATTGTGPVGTGNQADNTVTWAYLPPFSWSTSTLDWQIGAWGDTNGYPTDGMFWQERLQMPGPPALPNRIDASVTADFTNFAPTAADGTVTDANALSWTLDDDQVNAIHALSPAGSAQAMQLAMFTDSGEHILQGASTSSALTPTSVQAYRETSYGSPPYVKPLRIGKSVLFTDRPQRKVREFSYYWQSNGYLAPDICQFSEHITRAPAGSLPGDSGIKWWEYQQSPHQVIWAGLNNGKLISFTYDRDQEIFSPAQHQLGGNYYGGPPIVEWGTVIPSPDGTYDELWVTVLRTINGAEVRFMEVMGRYFDGGDPDTGFYADASSQTDVVNPAATLTMSGLTQNSPPDTLPETMPPFFTGSGTFVTSANIFTSGSVNSIIRVNGGKVVVTAYTDARHVTGQVLASLKSVTPALSGNWSCTPKYNDVSGLDYLEGEEIVLIGDGANLGEATVSSGTVPLDPPASLVYAGLPYTPVIVTMPFELTAAAGANSQGKMKRIDTLNVRFYETLGAMFGRRMTDDMTNVVYDEVERYQNRGAQDAMDNAPQLYSGIQQFSAPGSHDREGQIIITQDEPLPMTVLGIFAQAAISGMQP